MNHYEMIDAVNNAATQTEHDAAELRLEGWRLAADHFGFFWSGVAADMHTMETHGDVDMCCGVLMDWKPASAINPGGQP